MLRCYRAVTDIFNTARERNWSKLSHVSPTQKTILEKKTPFKKERFLKWKTLFPQSATQHQRQNPNPLTTPRSPAFPFHLWDWFKLQDEHSGRDPHSALSSATHRGARHPLWGCSQLRASFHKNWASLSPAMPRAGICSDAFSGRQTGDSVVRRTAKCSQSQPNAARAMS